MLASNPDVFWPPCEILREQTCFGGGAWPKSQQGHGLKKPSSPLAPPPASFVVPETVWRISKNKSTPVKPGKFLNSSRS